MKNIRVKLVPLAADDREQFILDNQWSFKHSALLEFGERDNHIDADGEIISRKTVEMCMDAENSEIYRIVLDGKNVGGMILQINKETNENELDTLFVLPEAHSKGIGYGAWLAAEALHPETKIWKTCTPYFDKRNIHFYINKCGFQIDEFWCEHFKPTEEIPDEASDEGPDEMLIAIVYTLTADAVVECNGNVKVLVSHRCAEATIEVRIGCAAVEECGGVGSCRRSHLSGFLIEFPP